MSNRLIIPNTILRGLQRSELSDVLRRAANDGYLLWSDAKGVRGEMRKLIWMSVVGSSKKLSDKNLSDWSNCIKNLPSGIKNQSNESDWLHWVADRAVQRDLSGGSKKNKFERIIEFSKAYPNRAGAITIFMMDHLDNSDTNPPSPKILKMFLGQLALLDWINIPQDLLMATKSWVIYGVNIEQVDLLDRVLNKLKGLGENPLVDAEKNSIVIKKISELIKSRS